MRKSRNDCNDYRYDFWVTVFVIIVMLLLVWALGDPPKATAEKVNSIEYHVVQVGDTLWKIAKKYHPEKDPREVVHEIEKLNGITPVIYPGQIIKVPTD